MIQTLTLPWTAPPLTKNAVRRMHHQAEAKARREAIEQVRWLIRAGRMTPMSGANVTLHWQLADRRRRDGDGAAPTLALAIDALVLEGILPDDSWVHVPHCGITVHGPQDGLPGSMWIVLEHPDGA